MVKATYSYSKIFLFIVTLIVTFIYFIGLFYNTVPESIVPYTQNTVGNTCLWKPTDPVIYNYRIDKLSRLTSYDGTDSVVDDYLILLYSIVKERQLLSDHSTIIYNIDRGEYDISRS